MGIWFNSSWLTDTGNSHLPSSRIHWDSDPLQGWQMWLGILEKNSLLPPVRGREGEREEEKWKMGCYDKRTSRKPGLDESQLVWVWLHVYGENLGIFLRIHARAFISVTTLEPGVTQGQCLNYLGETFIWGNTVYIYLWWECLVDLNDAHTLTKLTQTLWMGKETSEPVWPVPQPICLLTCPL